MALAPQFFGKILWTMTSFSFTKMQRLTWTFQTGHRIGSAAAKHTLEIYLDYTVRPRQ
jgi:hypothetical protein